MKRYKIRIPSFSNKFIDKVDKKTLDDGIKNFKKEIKKLHHTSKPRLYKINTDVLEEFKAMLSIK